MSRLVLLALLGLVMIALTAAAPWAFEVHRESGFVLVMMATGIVALVASLVIRGAPEGAALAIVVAVAVVVRVLAMAEPPLLSSDVYRYVWDGRVQGAGINPFRYIPADPALASLRDTAIFPNMNRADYARTAYPPVAQMFFFLATRFADTLDAMRLALVACEIGIVAALLVLLRRLERPRSLIVAYAWHPLAIWEIANAGHADALMAMLAVAGVLLLVLRRRVLGALVVACGVLVKPYAIVLLPIFWRPWELRAPLLVLSLVAILYLPYIGVGTDVLGFVPVYIHQEGFVDGGGFWLVALARALFGNRPGILEAYLAIAVISLGLGALHVLRRPAFYPPREQVRDAVMLLLVGLFFLSPNYPWYYLALVPFVSLLDGGILWVATLSATLLHVWWPTPDDQVTRFLIWKTVMNGAWIAALVGTWLIERGRHVLEARAAAHSSAATGPLGPLSASLPRES
ncbi:hypothetical protein EYW49_20370 [Siculibacillus lacustris]|uniref:DUF2029 domain-containing protein n=1 Tax=Siculibacillus lacustris TaxID=1549641 RepID=A0A4Q9VF92_9HYPH|nr:hypothetical protein [Siculibacillus lacustris]TBW33423.1 hypothetical protein EYW49_20370 [Siculibacillus lacustris]